MIKKLIYFSIALSLFTCNERTELKQYITILGVAQDGGYPHIGCQKICCADFYDEKKRQKKCRFFGFD